MGTRADFYVGRGKDAEWLGSVAWDGYPSGFPNALLTTKTEADYRAAVDTELRGRKDGTLPEMGWPWPWEDSNTTDYAYAFDGGKVWATAYDETWFEAAGDEPDEEAEIENKPKRDRATFPDMSARKNVTFGDRSGLMIIGGK